MCLLRTNHTSEVFLCFFAVSLLSSFCLFLFHDSTETMVPVCWLGSVVSSCNGACQMVPLQRAKFFTVSTGWFSSAVFFSFLTDRTNQDPMKSVSGCLMACLSVFEAQRGHKFSSHPFHSVSPENLKRPP